MARAQRGVSRAELRAAVDEAVAEAGADVLDAIGGVDLESSWGRLLSVAEFARQEIARARAAEVRNHEGAGRSRLTILRTIGEVHRALRNDRSRRRLQLAQVSTGRLTEVLPVWVGSAADVEELLPLRVGLFDVVVVEDATTVTTGTVAAALLRARGRLVVFGDPDRRAVEGDLFALAAGRRAPLRLVDQFGVAPRSPAGPSPTTPCPWRRRAPVPVAPSPRSRSTAPSRRPQPCSPPRSAGRATATSVS